MRAAVSQESCRQANSYCIWWRRVGGADRFRHWVLAESIGDAVSRSRLQISKALGPNASLWRIEEPENKITRTIRTDVVGWREGPRQSSQRVGIAAFVLLFLGLVFLFHWKSRAVASAEPMEGGASSGTAIPEILSEKNPTAWPWYGFVQSAKDQ
jgi:hypothetical protein